MSMVVLPLAVHLCTLQAPLVRRGRLVVTYAGTINVNDFKTGVTVEIDGVPYRVLGVAANLSDSGSDAVAVVCT